MKKALISIIAGLLCTTVALGQADQAAATKQRIERILAAEIPIGSQQWRVLKLQQSHRRHETVKLPGSGRTLQAFVVYPNPDIHQKVSVVLMVPEDQGLNEWSRDMADQIAAMGYIVVLPDVLSGAGPNGGGRDSFPDTESSMIALEGLKPEMIMSDLNTWADYGKKLEQANGKLAVVGFGWGGGRAFSFAVQRKDLNAAFIFYDWAPPGTIFTELTAPVYGFYAANDPRVTKSLDATKSAMAAAGKKFEPVTYPGSDHMFVRLGEEPGHDNPNDILARSLSLARFQELLKNM